MNGNDDILLYLYEVKIMMNYTVEVKIMMNSTVSGKGTQSNTIALRMTYSGDSPYQYLNKTNSCTVCRYIYIIGNT